MIEVLKQALDALEKVKRRAVVMGSTGDYREGQLDALKAISEDVKPAITFLQQAIAQLESQYSHGMYGAEDLDKAWKSGYDNCKDQYAYLDKQEPVAWADHGVVNWIADKQFKHPSLLYTHPPQRTWVGLMRGVRVEGNTVVITVKGGNDEARALCGELINKMEKNT